MLTLKVCHASDIIYLQFSVPSIVPEMLRNEPLETWNKKVAGITFRHLEYTDTDTPAEEITFIVSSPDRGYVAYKSDPAQPIFTFSQKDIYEERVVFVHTEKGKHRNLP